MAGLTAKHFPSLHFLCILYRDFSLAILKPYDKCKHGNDQNKNDHCCKNSVRDICCALDELIIQRDQITRNTCNNVDQQDNGNTISNTFFCNFLTKPHKECSSCRQSNNGNNHRCISRFCKESLITESDNDSKTFDQSKYDRKISCVLVDLLSSVFSIFLQFFQTRNCDGKKLYDNGCCDVRCDVQCKDGHSCKGSTGHNIEEVQRLIVIKQILDNICIYARKRNVTSDPDDDKPKKHKQKFVSDLFRLKRIFYRFKH